jgi:hypothetical protein
MLGVFPVYCRNKGVHFALSQEPRKPRAQHASTSKQVIKTSSLGYIRDAFAAELWEFHFISTIFTQELVFYPIGTFTTHSLTHSLLPSLLSLSLCVSG